MRDYLLSINFNKRPPAPALPEDVILNTAKKYDEALLKVCSEYDLDFPLVTHVQFGHTAPMLTLPLGVMARIDCKNKKLEIIESGVE